MLIRSWDVLVVSLKRLVVDVVSGESGLDVPVAGLKRDPMHDSAGLCFESGCTNSRFETRSYRPYS